MSWQSMSHSCKEVAGRRKLTVRVCLCASDGSTHVLVFIFTLTDAVGHKERMLATITPARRWHCLP